MGVAVARRRRRGRPWRTPGSSKLSSSRISRQIISEERLQRKFRCVARVLGARPHHPLACPRRLLESPRQCRSFPRPIQPYAPSRFSASARRRAPFSTAGAPARTSTRGFPPTTSRPILPDAACGRRKRADYAAANVIGASTAPEAVTGAEAVFSVVTADQAHRSGARGAAWPGAGRVFSSIAIPARRRPRRGPRRRSTPRADAMSMSR